MNKRFRFIAFVLLITMLIPIGASVVEAASKPVQIDARKLVFNTGVSSDQIKLLKDFFRIRNDKNVPWGYAYDDRTKELVRAYQKKNGLGSDGVAGTATINKINAEIKSKNYRIGLRKPNIKNSGDLILINKSSNTLYLMRNGSIFKSYPVATGKAANLTPDGKHKVVVKYVNPGWGGGSSGKPIPGGVPHNPLGTRWIGINYGGGGQYGMHGNSNPKSIGRYASAGCVRMFNEDVEDLYEHVKIGTPVWIGHEGLLSSYGVEFKEELPAPSKPKPEKPKPEKPKPEKPSKPVPPKPTWPKEQPNVKVKLNGEILDLSKFVLNNKNRTYHPYREILESVGAIVGWDKDKQTALAELDGNIIEFTINSNIYRVNGEKRILPEGQKPFLYRDSKSENSSTYIPIRYAMEALGFKVDWDEKTSTVLITGGDWEILEPEEPVEPEDPIETEDLEEDDPEKLEIEEIETDKPKEDEKIEKGDKDGISTVILDVKI